MTSLQRDLTLRRHLMSAHRRLLAGWVGRVSLIAGSRIALAITVVVVLGAFWASSEWGARLRLVALGLAGFAALFVAVKRYFEHAPCLDAYLESIERRFPEVRSFLRNALDFEAKQPEHTSPELARALSTETAARLARVPLSSLAPRLEPKRPLALMAAALAGILVLAVAMPEHAARSWATLWNPALAAPPVRLVVEPGSVKITPGAALAVRARVWGTPAPPTLERPGGGPPAIAEGGGADGAKVWRFDLSQLTRAQQYRVRAASAVSPWYGIALAGEPIPVGFEIEYRAPAYAHIPVQRGFQARGDLSALRGTEAMIEVTFDRDLEHLHARVPGRPAAAWTALTARRWRGTVTLGREGDYELEAQALTGQARHRYRIAPLLDAPPVIAVRLPEGDMDLPVGQQIPLEIMGQDDLGLSELQLEIKKGDAAWTEVPLARFAEHPREATVQSHWDASGLALVPGESASLRFVLWDDNAVTGRGRAVSPTFEIRFPSMADLYDKIEKQQNGVQSTLEKVAEQAHDLQKTLDRLAHQPVRASQQNPQSFERSEEIKSAVDRQQDLSKKIDEAAQQLRQSLEQAAERQAFNEELTRKLREMSELTEQIQSQDFRDALRRMQEALENLDRRQLEQNLPELRMNNRQMLAQLQRTIDLLKQLKQEEQIDALAKRADELRKRQDELNREHDARDQSAKNGKDSRPANEDQKSQALAEIQEQAAKQSEQLARDTEEMSQELDKPEDQKGLEEASSELGQGAAQAQHEASKATTQRKSSQASQSGKHASQSLQKAADQLAEMAAGMQQSREGADLAAVRRAAQDLVSLERENDGNLGSNDPIAQKADRQTDLSEGVARVADSLYSLAKKSPFITPSLGEALGRAMNQMQGSGRELGTGNRARGEELGHSGGTALNQAVLELRQTESQMCQNPGPRPGGQASGRTSQRLGQLGEQQSQLNGDTRKVARRLSEQFQMSAGDRQELQRMAAEQARIREQVEQIQKDDAARRELLGRLDQTQKEMAEAEEVMRDGSHLGDLEQKQQHILSRLLDASRSVNRRDFDPQRESRPGDDVARASAPEFPKDLLRENDRLRLDLLKAEADRYPAQYRAFIEAYLRALNGSRR